MKKDPREYLAQILERIERIVKYTAGGKTAFVSDSLAGTRWFSRHFDPSVV